jgi:carbonic anhydrase
VGCERDCDGSACERGLGRVAIAAMDQIDRLIEANEGYASARAHAGSARPSRRLAVVTCMDCRIDVFAVLGLHIGEAHVLRNAGGRITDDMLRSLALSTHVLGVDTLVMMQHTNCGLAGVTDAELQEHTGADLGFYPIDDHGEALREDIEILTSKSYLGPLKTIAGFVYDVESGELTDVARWQRPE